MRKCVYVCRGGCVRVSMPPPLSQNPHGATPPNSNTNKELTLPTRLNNTPSFTQYHQDDLLPKIKFSLAFENSIEPDYVTEKYLQVSAYVPVRAYTMDGSVVELDAYTYSTHYKWMIQLTQTLSHTHTLPLPLSHTHIPPNRLSTSAPCPW